MSNFFFKCCPSPETRAANRYWIGRGWAENRRFVKLAGHPKLRSCLVAIHDSHAAILSRSIIGVDKASLHSNGHLATGNQYGRHERRGNCTERSAEVIHGVDH